MESHANQHFSGFLLIGFGRQSFDERVEEGFAGRLEIYSVLREIGLRFAEVPLEFDTIQVMSNVHV